MFLIFKTNLYKRFHTNQAKAREMFTQTIEKSLRIVSDHIRHLTLGLIGLTYARCYRQQGGCHLKKDKMNKSAYRR